MNLHPETLTRRELSDRNRAQATLQFIIVVVAHPLGTELRAADDSQGGGKSPEEDCCRNA